MKMWIGEITCIVRKTVLIPANSRKEAIEILNGDRAGCESVDTIYGDERAVRVIREDKQRGIK